MGSQTGESLKGSMSQEGGGSRPWVGYLGIGV